MYGITQELMKKMQIANTKHRRTFRKMWLKSSQKVSYSQREISIAEETAFLWHGSVFTNLYGHRKKVNTWIHSRREPTNYIVNGKLKPSLVLHSAKSRALKDLVKGNLSVIKRQNYKARVKLCLDVSLLFDVGLHMFVILYFIRSP